MPFTAIHAPVVWALFISKSRRFELDFIALTMGAIIPDLFEPFAMTVFSEHYWSIRQVTHSLIGAVTVDLALALAGTLFVVLPVFRWLKKKNERLAFFAGVDITDMSRYKGRCGKVMVCSALIGTISHVTLDIFYHARNPLLYPMEPIALFPDLETLNIARLIIDVTLILSFLYILNKYYLADVFKGST